MSTPFITCKTIVLAMIITSGCYAAYIPNYTWNYGTLFGTDNDNAGLSQADSQGNKTYQYRYTLGYSPTDTTSLMGYYHSWEDPQTWQKDGNGWNTRIGSSYLRAGANTIDSYTGAVSALLLWTAPQDGDYTLAISLNCLEGAGGSAKVGVWIGDMVNAIKYSDNVAKGSTFSYSTTSSIHLDAGEQIAVTFGNGDGVYTEANQFGMQVQLVPEPAVLAYFLLGGMALALRRQKT